MISAKPFRLITISISHYCEKARWALDKLKLPYVEEPHMPPFHLLATKRLGGRLTPILVAEDKIICDSTDILKYLDSLVPGDKKLFPQNPELRQQVENLEELFDEQLGIAARLWGYSHTINRRDIIKNAWCNSVPFVEKISFPIVFPVMNPIARKKFAITDNSSKEAYEQIQEVFSTVDNFLSDGRKYLIGDNFSAADLTFAALSAPIIAPPEHPKRRGDIDDLPKQMIEEIKQMRLTKAGQLALRIYAEERS